MERQQKARKEEFVKNQDAFRSNALKIIEKMLDWCNRTPGSKPLVDEILHCIFFLGHINTLPFTPESIISDDAMLSSLREKYPGPFKFYKDQVPKRSPFSCVLDMIVMLKGQTIENQIKETLKELVNNLEKKFLVSTTICISQKSKDSVRHYGVSMSASDRNPGRIAIGASCFRAWDDLVSGSVMTYCLQNKEKTYFNGTIKLPQSVRCQAFNLSRGEEMPPCRSCGDLFGLPTAETKRWVYGHCAEAESVSNLLKNEAAVKRQAQPTSPLFTPANRQQAEESVTSELRAVLKTIRFIKGEAWDYYSPQTQ